jgi:CheY-like chemotaxis protein
MSAHLQTSTDRFAFAPKPLPSTPAKVPARKPNDPAAPTVLVADDDPTLRRLVCETLRAAGLCVLEAEDGRSALETAGHWNAPIDLLVTDVEMPHLDGPTLADKLVHQRPGLPVLFVSAREEVPGGEQRMPFTFLPKPFRLTSLLEKVRRLLGRGPWEKGVA